MSKRTCTREGCERRHLARGLCSSHYAAWHRELHGRHPSETFTRKCVVCDTEWETRRSAAKFCSDVCKGLHYSDTMRTKCPLPEHHPVMVAIRAERERIRLEREVAKRSRYEWRTARECPGCACRFTPLYTSTMTTCSPRCSRRMSKRRRRAREVNAYGSWVWSDFMRIARRFDYCCAYCGTKPGSLDPDHVMPLSRGGYDSVTNLLPACRSCNGDKRDLLLDEWAEDREARGKPPRMTNWAPEDKRYWHLTQVDLRVTA